MKVVAVKIFCDKKKIQEIVVADSNSSDSVRLESDGVRVFVFYFDQRSNGVGQIVLSNDEFEVPSGDPDPEMDVITGKVVTEETHLLEGSIQESNVTQKIDPICVGGRKILFVELGEFRFI